jgi:small subunit ribosomal protein S9
MVEKKKARAKKTTAKKKKTVKKAAKKEVIQKPAEAKIEEVKAEKPAPPPVPAAVAPAEKEKVVTGTKKERLPGGHKFYGTGRRKEATAKVWLVPGSGKIVVNGRGLSEYFCGRKLLEFQARRPLAVTNTKDNYDVYAQAFGGGIPGQAGALSMGIARALLEVSPDLRVKLKREGLLRRDPRMKERKKYGLKRARRAFQYTKR